MKLVLAVVIATYAAAQAAPGLRGAIPLEAASTSETADQGRVGAEIKSSRAIAATAHDPSDDASLLRPALEFMIAAGTKGEPNEDVDDGEAYQDDYADILVEEAEDRYKDILDYTDYEYAADGEEEEGAAWRCDDGGCHEVDGDADYADDDEHKDEDEEQTWRCGDDGCHQVVDGGEVEYADAYDYADDNYEN